MLYVFEDSKDDVLSILFRSAYPEEISSKFIYSGGHTKLLDIVEELLCTTNEVIVAYIDIVPENMYIRDTYIQLQRLSREHSYRLVVFTIVCAENVFIKTFSEYQNLRISDWGIDIVLSDGLWFDAEMTQQDKSYVRNYERFCKLVLKKDYVDCIKHTKDNNSLYGKFYMEDCLCGAKFGYCSEFNLVSKSLQYLSGYPCVPSGYYGDIGDEMSIARIWEVHRQCIDKCNVLVKKYGVARGETDGFKLYEYIR